MKVDVQITYTDGGTKMVEVSVATYKRLDNLVKSGRNFQIAKITIAL